MNQWRRKRKTKNWGN